MPRSMRSGGITITAVLGATLALTSAGTLPVAAQSAPPADVEETGKITVWIDSTRQAAVDAFKAAHPELADRIEVSQVDIDNVLVPKIMLFNNAGSGWPDVVFADPNLGVVANLSDASRNYPLDLRDYVSQDVLDGFAEGANGVCTQPDGKLVCLRNDLAQNVLWYNKPLMDEFGYEVPTTWEEYEALGLRLAQEHPGYVIGGFGGDGIQALWQYFWPARCPTGQVQSVTTVYINVLAPECMRVVKMLDNLIQAGAIAKFEPFDPGFVSLANDNKLLMMPAGSWYGPYIFGGKPDSLYYHEANHQLGVAPPLKWEGEDTNWTGSTGGGAWLVSRHTESPKLATEFVEWVTTAEEYQGKLAPTYPAYAPAAKTWLQGLASDPLYASDPGPVLTEAANVIEPTWGPVRYARENLFSTVVISAVNAGSTIESAMQEYQNQLVQLAESSGYEVVTSK